jgi:hypothetical protein
MEMRDLIVGLVAGAVAIVFSTVPGLFSSLTLGVRNFGERLRFGASVRPYSHTEADLKQRPLGLAMFGAVLMRSQCSLMCGPKTSASAAPLDRHTLNRRSVCAPWCCALPCFPRFRLLRSASRCSTKQSENQPRNSPCSQQIACALRL